MSGLLAHGRVLDFIIAGMVFEGLGLTVLFRLHGRGVSPRALLPNLVSGACLLVAMRLALSGQWWGFVAAGLLGALLMHLLDLRLRWVATGQ